MTTKSVANKVSSLGIGETAGQANIDYLLRRKKKVVCTGYAAAGTGDYSGCVHYFEKAAEMRGLKISSLIQVDDHAADIQTVTVGYNDGAGGAPVALGHWATTTGEEGVLTALHMEDMAGFTDRTVVPAGSYLTVTNVLGGGGKDHHFVIEFQYEEIG